MKYLLQGKVYSGKEILQNLKDNNELFITFLDCDMIKDDGKYKVVADGKVTMSWEHSNEQAIYHTGYLVERA
ncbi:hypothetical protein [Clostridium estertheticum]|uniref:hypothetical protein n=1 Tax=Clostridium estertheticum TaxID=238834 RepID=UPI001C7DAF8D|nr:hypothetical protein [Clostridium estertheticum]MBX4271461.1 hypothetical protein [Clostridium estertheticum]WLC81014.1 hypothetical protein KTC98_07260 [Clostridium estertheticum]